MNRLLFCEPWLVSSFYLVSKSIPWRNHFTLYHASLFRGLALGRSLFRIGLGARFRREADAHYVEAKRSTVAGIAQIPYWIYGMLVVLGWNEAMMILFNPMYFTMVLVLAASA